MAELRGLRAIRYDPARVGEIGQVIAPPYDIISPAEQVALYDQHPANVIRLELARTEPGQPAESRYSAAAATWRRWREEGLLLQETEPAIFVYDHTFTQAGQRQSRRGFFAAVRLVAWSAGQVLPHEHTLPTPKADRLNLYRATAAQISPIFSLYEDPDGEIANLLRWTTTAPPLVTTTAPDGDEHRLWRLDEPALIEELSDLFAGRPLFIADGHHRYETGLAYHQERLAAGDTESEAAHGWTMMYLSDVADPGLVILPTHRLITTPPPAATGHIEPALRQAFHVEPLSASLTTAALLERLAERRRSSHAFIWLTAAGMQLLTLKDESLLAEWMPADRAPAWRRLDVAVAQVLILDRALGIEATDTERYIDYTRDAEAARAAVNDGQAEAAVLVSPTDLASLLAIARAGDQMPQKSTYFYPKVPTGLVMYSLE